MVLALSFVVERFGIDCKEAALGEWDDVIEREFCETAGEVQSGHGR